VQLIRVELFECVSDSGSLGQISVGAVQGAAEDLAHSCYSGGQAAWLSEAAHGPLPALRGGSHASSQAAVMWGCAQQRAAGRDAMWRRVVNLSTAITRDDQRAMARWFRAHGARTGLC
jgi:hypothetical protein